MDNEKQEVVEEEVVEEVTGDDEDEFEEITFKFDDDDEDDEEEEEPEEVEPVEEPVDEVPKDEEPVQEPQQKVFTQEEVNKIVGNARIKGRELEEQVQMLEQQTGMKLPEVNEYVKQQAAQTMVDEYGIPEAEANQIVDNQHKVKVLEESLQYLNHQQQVNQQLFTYNQEKQQFLNNPLVKQYEAEIDAISQGGQQLGFEAAMRYVLGGKLVEGNLADNIRSGAQQQNIRQKRPMPAPEGVAGGASASQSAPKELQALARAFGVDQKNVAKEYFREQKRKPF